MKCNDYYGAAVNDLILHSTLHISSHNVALNVLLYLLQLALQQGSIKASKGCSYHYFSTVFHIGEMEHSCIDKTPTWKTFAVLFSPLVRLVLISRACNSAFPFKLQCVRCWVSFPVKEIISNPKPPYFRTCKLDSTIKQDWIPFLIFIPIPIGSWHEVTRGTGCSQPLRNGTRLQEYVRS